jgi:hypothetical protein
MSLLLAFVLGCVIDWVWASYIRAVASTRAIDGAVYAGCIVLMSACTTLLYVADHRAVLPAAAGAAFGTWLSVRLS